jgi:hypothetical protein
MSTSTNYKCVNRNPETSKKFQWAYPTDLILPAAFPVSRWILHSPKRACVWTHQYRRTPELVFLEMASQHGSSIGYSDVGVYCKKNLTSFRPTFDRTGKCRRASQQNTFLRTTHATWTYIRLQQHENLYWTKGRKLEHVLGLRAVWGRQ